MIPPIERWPPDLYFLFCERASIKIDSHIPEAEAEQQAMHDIWSRHAEPKQNNLW